MLLYFVHAWMMPLTILLTALDLAGKFKVECVRAVHQLSIKHDKILTFSSQKYIFNLSGNSLDAWVVLVPTTNPGGIKSVNVIKCHFTVWSADMEKLLFSFWVPLKDQ